MSQRRPLSEIKQKNHRRHHQRAASDAEKPAEKAHKKAIAIPAKGWYEYVYSCPSSPVNVLITPVCFFSAGFTLFFIIKEREMRIIKIPNHRENESELKYVDTWAPTMLPGPEPMKK